MRATFITDYIGITVVQGMCMLSKSTEMLTYHAAIIVLRAWYILSGRLHARIFVLTVFLASAVISLRDFVAIVPSVGRVSPVPLPLGGCPAPPIANVWTIFLPYLIAQTVLFSATLWPSLQLRSRGHSSQIMSRLVRECVDPR